MSRTRCFSAKTRPNSPEANRSPPLNRLRHLARTLSLSKEGREAREANWIREAYGEHPGANAEGRMKKASVFPFDKLRWAEQVLCMVAVNSTMLPLGTQAPDFRLRDPSGKAV